MTSQQNQLCNALMKCLLEEALEKGESEIQGIFKIKICKHKKRLTLRSLIDTDTFEINQNISQQLTIDSPLILKY